MEFSESAAAALVQSTLQGSSPYIISLDTELEGLLQTLDDIQALTMAVSDKRFVEIREWQNTGLVQMKAATTAAQVDSTYSELLASLCSVSRCHEWILAAEVSFTLAGENFAETLAPPLTDRDVHSGSTAHLGARAF
jgi:hypothetical protein